MSEFTPGTVRDLRYLYENVVHGEQEVLNEGPGMDIFNTPAVQKSNAASVRPFFTPNPGPGMNAFAGTPGRMVDQAQKNKATETILGLKSGSLSRSSTSKPPATPAGTRPTGNAPATAPGGAGAGSPPNARSMPARPVLSKQGGVEGTGTGANFKAGAWSSADKSRYSAQAAKTTPTAPKPAIGKLGNTSFERRTPTSAELSAAQSARAGGAKPEQALQAAQKTNLPTTGPTPAVPDRASISADLAKANANANRPAPAGSALSKQQALKPVTPSAAVAAAPSSSPAASGSVVPATNAIAAAPKPIIPNPSGGYSTKEGDGKPRKDVLFSYQYEDAYDLVLEYLLDDGHAATIAEAEYIMTELDSEVINQIVETRLDPRGRPASGPMNVYRDPKGKPDQAHLDAIKSYDEKQKKKTPEQRKKELDAYIARQRNK